MAFDILQRVIPPSFTIRKFPLSSKISYLCNFSTSKFNRSMSNNRRKFMCKINRERLQRFERCTKSPAFSSGESGRRTVTDLYGVTQFPRYRAFYSLLAVLKRNTERSCWFSSGGCCSVRFVNNIVSRFPYFLRWTSFRSCIVYGGSTFLWSTAIAHDSMKNVRSQHCSVSGCRPNGKNLDCEIKGLNRLAVHFLSFPFALSLSSLTLLLYFLSLLFGI